MTGPDRCRGDGFLRVFGLTCFAVVTTFVAVVIAKVAGIA